MYKFSEKKKEKKSINLVQRMYMIVVVKIGENVVVFFYSILIKRF